MTAMFLVLAITGCGDDGAACGTARIEPTRYATAAQCRAQLPAALTRNADLDFPTVAADCRTIGTQAAAVPKGARRG